MRNVYVDMDGVLTNFDGAWRKYFGDRMSYDEYKSMVGQNVITERLKSFGKEFWSEMEWADDGKELWGELNEICDPIILTAPALFAESRIGKVEWVTRELGLVPIILDRSKYKYACIDSILIDDRKQNIDEFEYKGGTGILHTSLDSTLVKLGSYM